MSYDLSRINDGGLLKRSDGGEKRTLIVLVHGWRVDTAQWHSFIELAGEDSSFENCDFYLSTYSRHVGTQADLEQLGAALSGGIDLYAKDYTAVVLIGYSIGGLIVRSAFLHALGVIGGGGHPWAGNVTRIVLMATPNRGLGGPGTRIDRRLALVALRLFGPRYLRDATKGSDFITRLRLDWVYAFRDPDIRTPEVVQLLGLEDEYVRREDSTDVTIFREAKQFTLSTARHADLASFHGPTDEKYLRLRMSCFDPLTDVPSNEPSVGERPSAVVFELHGIRDYGGWLRKFAQVVMEIDANARVVGPGFGWFSVLSFIMPWIRRRRIAWFCDRYTEEVAALSAREIDDVPFYFVGHSYGTYLFAECLKRFPRMHFRRACLVGSVLPESFMWHEIIVNRKQLQGLRNDCASHDWPVGVCCRVLSQVGVKELGIGGFVGFRVGTPDAVDYLHIPGNHSAPLTCEQGRHGIAEYLLRNNPTPPQTVTAPRWLQVASHLALPIVACAVFLMAPSAVYVVDQLAHWIGIAPHVVVGGIVVSGVLLLIYA